MCTPGQGSGADTKCTRFFSSWRKNICWRKKLGGVCLWPWIRKVVQLIHVVGCLCSAQVLCCIKIMVTDGVWLMNSYQSSIFLSLLFVVFERCLKHEMFVQDCHQDEGRDILMILWCTQEFNGVENCGRLPRPVFYRKMLLKFSRAKHWWRRAKKYFYVASNVECTSETEGHFNL